MSEQAPPVCVWCGELCSWLRPAHMLPDGRGVHIVCIVDAIESLRNLAGPPPEPQSDPPKSS